jgi:hypothetical protein
MSWFCFGPKLFWSNNSDDKRPASQIQIFCQQQIRFQTKLPDAVVVEKLLRKYG